MQRIKMSEKKEKMQKENWRERGAYTVRTKYKNREAPQEDNSRTKQNLVEHGEDGEI